MKKFKTTLPEINIKYSSSNTQKANIKCSKDAAGVFREIFDADTLEWRETFMAMFLNQSNNTIGFFKVSHGGKASTIIDSKILFPPALLSGASGIILCHNHPSGDNKPSGCDIKLTKKLIQASKYLDLTILDHIILTKNSYLSMKDECLI